MQEVPVNPEPLVHLERVELAKVWPNQHPHAWREAHESKIEKSKEAVKFDDGKVDWTLVPFEALEGMAQVLQFGARKYAAWNWTEGGGFKWTRILGSCLRHIFAFMRGEDNDPESGLSHISHAQCNLLFLAYYIRNKDKFSKDDRNVR